MNYPYAIHKDPDSDYGVSFPDLPGCISLGSTVEEARRMAQEAAETYLGYLADKNEQLPSAGKIDDYLNDPQFVDALFWGVVTIDKTKLGIRAKRINITVSEDDLAAIDLYAHAQGMNRSNFLVATALEKINA